MKQVLLIFFLNLITLALFAPEDRCLPILQGARINPWIPGWNAVKWVETRNNPDTINYIEQAYGPGQIRQGKLDDFNRANGTCYTLIDCLDEELSRRIFMWHCSGYNDFDLAIRRWNGSGPATYEYLKMVNLRLKQPPRLAALPLKGEKYRI